MSFDLFKAIAQTRGRATPRQQALPLVKRGVRIDRRSNERLLVFRMGLGRDSVTMLLLLIHTGLLVEGKVTRLDDVDAVVFTNPGNEWWFTLDLIERIQALADRHGFRFLVQDKPPPKGSQGWVGWLSYRTRERNKLRRAHGIGGARLPPLVPPWRRSPPSSIEARAASGYYHLYAPIIDEYVSRGTPIFKLGGSCTANHKIVPNRDLLHDLSLERWGIPLRKPWNLRTRVDGAPQPEALWPWPLAAGVRTPVPSKADRWVLWGDLVDRGLRRPHRVLLGIAADEATRSQRAEGKAKGPSFEKAVYPLVEMGVTKVPIQDVTPPNRKRGESESAYGRRVEAFYDQIDQGRARARRLLGLELFNEEAILTRYGFNDVRKSGCMACKFAKKGHFWVLRETEPDLWAKIVSWERKAMARNPRYSFFPKKGQVPGPTISQVIRDWRRRNPDATVESVIQEGFDICNNPASGL